MGSIASKFLVIRFVFIIFLLNACGSDSSTTQRVSANERDSADGKINPSEPSPAPSQIPEPSNTPSPLPAPTPNSSECYKATAFICKVEQLITVKTNAYRQNQGRQGLVLNQKIAFVARDWSQKQGSRGTISHDGFPNLRIQVFNTEFNESISLYGENVAMSGRVNYTREDDQAAEAIANEFAVMWWNSSGHRANMLNSGFSSIGVGVYKAPSSGYWYATQIFK